MQKHEFERLTGMTVDEATFSHAEDIYLAAGSLTKEEVCREIKEHPWLLESETVSALAEEMQDQRHLAAKRLVDIEKLKAALLDAASTAGEAGVWKSCRELLGSAEVIKYKINAGDELDDADLAYIKENLQ